VDPRAGLEDVEKRKFWALPGFGRPARRKLLYRLRYSKAENIKGKGRIRGEYEEEEMERDKNAKEMRRIDTGKVKHPIR
jgi:hypothetical protein